MLKGIREEYLKMMRYFVSDLAKQLQMKEKEIDDMKLAKQ